uniref:monocarboxylate transporter 5-like isoform X1 n=1 Tax=Vespula vulgaris TaxID=7454 RepID=UPI00213AC309|nr:monocarboxylate transporter 5-like isoform X1 [Vespula vulgaris]
MSVLKHLYLDDIITSFPELGPTVQDGGYSWIILIGVFLIQMTIPSILSVYGIVLGYLTENKTGEFDLWDQKIILTPMLFIAFWSLADPWSKMIVDLSSVPRIIGLIGIALISIGVLASGYLATGGVGAYLASLSAGAVMGIGASFVLIQSQECLQKYFRIKLSVAFTIRNIALSLGYIIVPSLTHFLLMQVHLKIALLLITIIFIPTILGVALLRQPMSPKPSRYNLLLTTEDDSEVSAKYLSNVNMGVESTENNNLENSSCERTEQIEDTNSSFAGNNEIYTYEDSEEDIFVNSTIKSNNKWKNQIQIFLYFRFWTIILTWVGIKSFTLFFWILLPYMFITKISSSQDYVTISIIAGFGTLLPNSITFLILQAAPQNRRLLFGIACWLGCSILVVLTYTTEYYVFMACALLGGICIGGLSVCQDSILCDIFGPRFIHQFHKVFSTVVGISLLSLCFVRNAILCFHLVALLLLLSGCYWIWLPILNIVKQRCIGCYKST